MRIYIDLDDTIFDYQTAHHQGIRAGLTYPQAHYDFYRDLAPLPDAIESIERLASRFDVWFASRPSYLNPLSYTEKRVSIETHFGLAACERLILIPDKSLLIGDVLIDDGDRDGQPCFAGQWLQFGTASYPDWPSVADHIINGLE